MEDQEFKSLRVVFRAAPGRIAKVGSAGKIVLIKQSLDFCRKGSRKDTLVLGEVHGDRASRQRSKSQLEKGKEERGF